ncbi:DUF3575 domain-containing protein [Sphingobacteriales bacterium UPWRP_1]|nr:hypothetical protein BVG80_11570 [Sphingobacteriales bacterium TSM_CSM]PSJ76483.1 DUF3575 domain-containing protein [Sphingobacteriales bacterium UPWRP_1]
MIKSSFVLLLLVFFCSAQPAAAQFQNSSGNYCIAAGGNMLIGLTGIDPSLSPSLHFERAFNKHISVYSTAIYIGNVPFINDDDYDQRSGVVAGFGFRYYFVNWILKKPLEGFYIGVQPLVQSYQRTTAYNYYPQGTYKDNTRVIAGGVSALAGGRWISRRNISLDIWIGAGMLGGQVTNRYGAYPPATTVTEINENRTMGLFNSGMSVGYIF